MVIMLSLIVVIIINQSIMFPNSNLKFYISLSVIITNKLRLSGGDPF